MCQLSIVLCVYKTEQYLPRCLDSLVSQGVSDLEIVVVNDGSPGNCSQIVAQYREKYSAITFNYIGFPENRGTMAAKITGFRAARGEYLMTVDPDDWLGLDTCRSLLQAIVKYNADIVQFPMFNADGQGNRKLHSPWRKVVCKLQGPDVLRGFLGNKVTAYLTDKLYRRPVVLNAINDVPFFDNQHIVQNEDRALMMAIGRCADSYVSICRGAYYYFANPDNPAEVVVLDEERFKKKCHDIHIVNQGILQLLKEKNVSQDLREKYIEDFMQPMAVLLKALREQPVEKFNRLYPHVFKTADPALAVGQLGEHEFIGFYQAMAQAKNRSRRPTHKAGFLFNSLSPQLAAQLGRWKEGFASYADLQSLPAERHLRWRRISNEIEKNDMDTLFYYGAITTDTLYDIGATVYSGSRCVVVNSGRFDWNLDIADETMLALSSCIYKLADVVVFANPLDAAIWKQCDVNAVYGAGLFRVADNQEDIYVPQPDQAWQQILYFSENENIADATIHSDGRLRRTADELKRLLSGYSAQTLDNASSDSRNNYQQKLGLRKRLKKIRASGRKESLVRNQPAIWLWFAPKYFWWGARIKSFFQPGNP